VLTGVHLTTSAEKSVRWGAISVAPTGLEYHCRYRTGDTVKKSEDRTIEYQGPEFTCDVSATDMSDEMCIREFLRIRMPVAV
jgi:hypothetical protein